MKGKKKKIINAIFVILCFVLTIYYVFHGKDIESIAKYMSEAKSLYWLLGVFCVVIFIISESFVIHFLVKKLEAPVKLIDCFLYSFVGFFFSCITPSASGGQPAQVFFMRKNDIPVHVSTVILLMITISYKMVLLIYGFSILLYHKIKWKTEK